MKKIGACIVLMFLTAFSSCIARGGNGSVVTGKAPQHTKEAKRVLKTLRKAAQRKTPYFGHQDALLYGQNWWINERDSQFERSDVYEVCGQYPYVLGLDLGKIEKGDERNLDRCLFQQMRKAAIMHYKRGGLVTISWHMDNPVTDSTAWDRTERDVVKTILNDSLTRKKYLLWLDKGADFLNQLVDEKGRKIPVLFRPLHECNIESFWWSPSICTDEDYIALWRMTFDYYVKEKKMTQLLWVYSPYNIMSAEEIESRYPGDEYVDVIGYERYQLGALTNQIGAERFVDGVKKGLDITITFAESRKKITAFTETGFTGVPYDKWWTEALGKAVFGKKIAYIVVWRNGVSENYYFGPCLKSASAPNFKELIKGKKIKLLKRK